MNWILGRLIGNPVLIVWIALGAFAAGSGAAWTIQSWRLDAVQSKYDGFVATTKALGDAAQVAADKAAADNKHKKEQADRENTTTLNTLRADVKRMRDARSNSGFLPPASALSLRTGRACFDRAELESAVRELDSGVQGIIDAGDAARVNLDTVKRWAAD